MRWIVGFAAITVVVGTIVKRIVDRWTDYKVSVEKPIIEEELQHAIMIKELEYEDELKALDEDHLKALELTSDTHKEHIQNAMKNREEIFDLHETLSTLEKTVQFLDELKEIGHITTREDARRTESGEFVRVTSDPTSAVSATSLALCFQFLHFQEVVLNVGRVNRAWNSISQQPECFRVLDFSPENQLWKIGADTLVALSQRFCDVTLITNLHKLSLIHISVLSKICVNVRAIADSTSKPTRNYISALQKLILANDNTLEVLKFPEKASFLKFLPMLKILWTPACIFEISIPFLPSVQALIIDDSFWGSLDPSMVSIEQQKHILNKFINLKFLKSPLASRGMYEQLPISLTHLVVVVSMSKFKTEQTHATFGRDEVVSLVLRCRELQYLHIKRLALDAALVLSHLPDFETLKVDSHIDIPAGTLRTGIKFLQPPFAPMVLEIEKGGVLVVKQKEICGVCTENGVQFD